VKNPLELGFLGRIDLGSLAMAEPVMVGVPPQDDMLKAVGKGIQAFTNVEAGLNFLFASIMEPANRGASVIALDAARHIEAKLRIVRAVAGVAPLTKAHKTKCTNLLNRIGRRAELRHKLAHWTVGYWPGVKSVKDVKKLRPALIPPMTSPQHGAVVWGGEQPIHFDQIEKATAACNTLFEDLVLLSNAISEAKKGEKPPSEAPEHRPRLSRIKGARTSGTRAQRTPPPLKPSPE